jgi:hypothetical protein
MHFWSLRPLAKELAQGKIDDRLGMAYFLASTLIVLVQAQYALWWGPRSGWLFFFEFLVLAAAACVGCLACWKANNGRDFVLRAICFSVPAGLRVFALGLAFGLLLRHYTLALFDHQTFSDPARAFELVSYAWFVGFTIYFWVLIHRGMQEASRFERAAGPVAAA